MPALISWQLLQIQIKRKLAVQNQSKKDFSKPGMNRASKNFHMYVTVKDVIVARALVNSHKSAIDKCFGDDGYWQFIDIILSGHVRA